MALNRRQGGRDYTNTEKNEGKRSNTPVEDRPCLRRSPPFFCGLCGWTIGPVHTGSCRLATNLERTTHISQGLCPEIMAIRTLGGELSKVRLCHTGKSSILFMPLTVGVSAFHMSSESLVRFTQLELWMTFTSRDGPALWVCLSKVFVGVTRTDPRSK